MTIIRFCIVIILGLTLISCASMPDMQMGAIRQAEGLDVVSVVIPGFVADKAIYDPISGNLFIMERQSQKVFIYKGDKLLNVIGGIGFENGNFKRLNDIELDSDGSLLCLDSLTKVVKRFSADGAYISEIALGSLVQPQYLCTTGDQTMFVYDNSSGEIVSLSALDHLEQYRFGRFQLGGIETMAASREFLITYAGDSGKTTLFSILGQKLEEYDGYYAMDAYRNFITDRIMPSGRIPGDAVPLITGTPGGSSLRSLREHQGYVTFVKGEQVSVHRIRYGASR